MRAFGWVVALALVGAVGYAFWSGAISIGLNAGVCHEDAEIDATLRNSADAFATTFFDGILKGEQEQTYATLSGELKTNMPADRFGGILKKIAGLGTFSPRKLEHIFQPSITGGDQSICKISTPDGSVIVTAFPNRTQVHLLYAAKKGADDWAFTTWLLKSETTGTWEVASFNLYPASLEGTYARDLMPLAAAQDKKGNELNAYLLYIGALGLADRGGDYRLGVHQDAESALKAFDVPEEVRGDPPYAWTFDGNTFSVVHVEITSAEKQLGLAFYYQYPEWDGKDNGIADKRNRLLLDGFVKKHPEFKEAFGFLVARALRTGSDAGFGTVYDAKTGYGETKKDSAK